MISPLDSNFSGRSRRVAERLSAVLAVELSSKEKAQRCGVTRNASERGLLVVTASRFRVGDEVNVSVMLGTAHGEVVGRVVRVEENPPTSDEVWRYRLALQLEQSLPEKLLEEAKGKRVLL